MRYRILGSEDIGQLNKMIEVYLAHGWSLAGGVAACRGSETGGSIHGIGGSIFQIWHAQAVTAPMDAMDPANAGEVEASAEVSRKAALRAKLDAFHAEHAARGGAK